ncbi:MAG: hypothetical protein IE910_12105 [Brevundimonas sp.]|nr:hypothetical protein [Brevundimonas sp.]
MQIRLLPAVMVFAGSYLPLALILLAQDFDYAFLKSGICNPILNRLGCEIPLAHPAFSLTIFVLCLLSFCFTLMTLSLARPRNFVDIVSVKYVPAELMSYTLPYVVSFMSIGYQDTGKFVGLTIFLIWMFWISYKSGQLILNPLLIAFGWRLYEVSYRFPGEKIEREARNGRALIRGELESGQRRAQVSVQDILIMGAINDKGQEAENAGT